MLRNPELRRALLLGGLVTLLASAAAALLSGWRAACVTLALGVVLLGLYTVELCRRYRAMARLAADIDAVLHGSGDIHLADYGEGKGVQVDFYQSNHEGALIDKIHASRTDYDGVVLNAGAYTHYSYAMRDAIEAVQDFTPYVEVHMSDIHQREDFRRISVLTPVCVKQICGFGKDSYKMGIDLLLEIL